MSATGNSTDAVVLPSFFDAFCRRTCEYEDGKGRTPLYPRADREQLGDQSNPEHEKFELRFRLLNRHEDNQRKFWDGPDHRTAPLSDFVGPDDFKLRFQGKIENGGLMPIKSFLKSKLPFLPENGGIWGWETYWEHVGRYSPRTLYNDIVGLLRQAGANDASNLKDKRLPLIPIR